MASDRMAKLESFRRKSKTGWMMESMKGVEGVRRWEEGVGRREKGEREIGLADACYLILGTCNLAELLGAQRLHGVDARGPAGGEPAGEEGNASQ